jgi:hypothetical protein
MFLVQLKVKYKLLVYPVAGIAEVVVGLTGNNSL